MSSKKEAKVSAMYGVVGCGVVGKAVIAGLEKNAHDWWGYDTKVQDTSHKFGSIFSTLPSGPDLIDTAVVFLCLPTQVTDCGYDLSHLDSTLRWLLKREYRGIVVIVSTISPEDAEYLFGICTGSTFSLFVAPEFLTAKNAAEEFYHPTDDVVYGPVVAPELQVLMHEALSAARDPHALFETVNLSVSECCLLKTWRNVALAQKLLTANMIYFDARNKGISALDSQNLVDKIFEDPRLSTDEPYTRIGNEEQALGFAGTCLPKDLAAMILRLPNNAIRGYLESAQHLNNMLRTLVDVSTEFTSTTTETKGSR